MSAFIIYLLTMSGIWGILSLSLNVQYGMAGLINLGHVAFFMIGAYVSTILVMLCHMPMLVGLAGGMLMAGLCGILFALPTANLREDYWAISTLAFAEVVRLFFLNQPLDGPYVGASFGVSGIPQPWREFFSTSGYNLFYLALVLSCLLLAFLFVSWLSRQPFGRTLKAIREGDEIPLALGKKVNSYRIRAMAIGGLLAGAAGSLFAHYNAFIAPEYFLPLETFLVWAMIILGGSGNHLGALVGTVLIQALYNSTRFLDDVLPIDASVLGSLRMVAIGILIIGVIIYLPQGLLPEKKRCYENTYPAES
jgi:branched-chain amino acid transport system permease protein